MMNTSSSTQRQLPFPPDENSLVASTTIVSPPDVFSPVLIPRSIFADPRLKSRTGGVDHDTSKLLIPTIKRSQAISNIQALDEDSPWTLDIEPNENYFTRKKFQVRFNPLASLVHRNSDDSTASTEKLIKNRSSLGEESDTRSESNEKSPEYIEEEKPILPGIHVKGATLNRLIRILIDSFGSDGTLIDDSEYPRVFFLMHKWIMESEYLSNMLYDLYKRTADDLKRTANTPEETTYKDYQRKICQSYHFWMTNYPMHFDLDKRLKETCQKLKDSIEQSADPQLTQLVDLSQIPSFDWMRQMTVRNQPRTKSVSLGFNNIEPQILAAQLTYLEWKFLRRITFSDYKTYAIKNTLQDNPRLERSIQFFNGLSTWIQCMVLSKMTPKQRAEVIHKFLDVAKYLREMQNFNTCLAVIGGISHSALARLSKTMMCLSGEDIKLLNEMTDLLSSNCNYAQYRKSLSECEGFKIPIIGVHLKDIISLHVALQDRLEYDLINFRKLVQLSIVFQTLTSLQVSVPPVQPNHDLIHLLTLSLDLSYTEDEIYELSVAREPRSSVSSPDQTLRILHSGDSTNEPISDNDKKKGQAPSPVFADWAAGVSQTIDIQTIQRHVNAMVEAVFTNYDHDRDGYISHIEFEDIAQNFPFIDTFTVLDADQDGMISKSEMRSYFLRAKYHDLKGEFKHDFHETTYFKLTFCVHCTGLLWGLIKQGWKCKDCGINVHRHCKDQVVMECRQKRSHTVNKQSSVTDARPSRNSFPRRKGRKQKATQTEDFVCPSSSTSSESSESCTSSSEDESPHPNSSNNEKLHHLQNIHATKPSSMKHRKALLSDSTDDCYDTHPPSPPQFQHTGTSMNPPAPQLIPRGPLICSDNFEKWGDRCFIWNRPLPPTNLLSSMPSNSTGTSDSTTSITTTTTKTEISEQDDFIKDSACHSQALVFEEDVTDDDEMNPFIETELKQHRTTTTTQSKPRTKRTDRKEIHPCGSTLPNSFHDAPEDETELNIDKLFRSMKSSSNFGSSQNLCSRKLSLTESLHSLPTKSDPIQNEIFERLRQAEEEKKRLEVENRAMKQELVRTKSKISSLKREMSSIQQLHLAQQQVQAQLSAPSMISSRQELETYHSYHQPVPYHSPLDTKDSPSDFTYAVDQLNPYYSSRVLENLSNSNNHESLLPSTTSTYAVQSTQTNSSLSPPVVLSTGNDRTNETLPSSTTNSLSKSTDLTGSPSDEQLRLYLSETLQREKDSTV